MTNTRDDLMVLAPCPFCGGEAERIDIPTVGSDPDLGGDPNAGGSCISCKRCAASTALHFDRKENLYSSWNDRAAQVVNRETVARIIKRHVSVTVAGAAYAPRDDVMDGVASAADAILSLPRSAEPVEAEEAGWTYETQHGPDGEAAYAWVYDKEHFLVCTAKIHHAKSIVDRMNAAASKPTDIVELLKLAYDNMFDGEAREQIRRKLFE